WEHAPRLSPLTPWRRRLPRLSLAIFFAALAATLARGTLATYGEAPAVAAQTRQQQDLARQLIAAGDTRVYADYWTCERMIFLSAERVICGVLGPDLAPAANRYPPYDAQMRAAPHPAYVFPLHTPQQRAFPAYAAAHGWRITSTVLDGQWELFTVVGAA
ncbi:MAG: hypothetical protein ACHQ4H_13410, partial [Ktedonobacterales bacterium]